MICKGEFSKMIKYFLAFLILTSVASAQMRDEKDKIITEAVVSQFRRECSHKGGIDQAKIFDLQKNYEMLRKEKTDESKAALGCYQERMAQMTGIHQLYKDLCEDVTRDVLATRPEPEQLRLL